MYAQFVITGILDEVIAHKVSYVNTQRMANLLNNHLTLDRYGSGITGISFFFIVTAPEDVIHTEFTRYSRKDQELHLQLRLPYEEVLHAAPEQVLHMMAQKYLQALQIYLPKKKIADFNWQVLVRDVEILFTEQGWLETVEHMH
jgi:Immunity protein 44